MCHGLLLSPGCPTGCSKPFPRAYNRPGSGSRAQDPKTTRAWSWWGGRSLPLYGGCGTPALKPDLSLAPASMDWGAAREGSMEEGALELNVWNEHAVA